jgi:hypothetical protein
MQGREECATMKLLPTLLVLILLAPGGLAQLTVSDAEAAVRAAPAAMATITAADLRARLVAIASDEYEGRLTGTRGQARVAQDMAGHFAQLGLLPLGDPDEDGKRGYFQRYPVVLTEVGESSGLLDAEGRRLNRFGAFSLPRGAMARADEAVPQEANLPVRFLGRHRKGMLADQDLSGVIPVLTLEFDTSEDATMDVMTATMRGMTRELGAVRAVASELAQAQATCGVILARRMNLPFLTAANMMLTYPGKPSLRLAGRRADPFGVSALRTRVPILILGGEDSLGVLSAMGLDASGLDADAAPRGPSESHFTFRLLASEREARVENVVGLLPGTDPALKEEAIVYSAHMDHVGLAADGQVFNGADDDGSGTVALMELAEAFAALPEEERPARGVIFLSVSGEELGLWGSAHFAENPTWPREGIVANINIDMIGRSTERVPPTAVAATPTHRHRAYSTLVREAAFLGQAFDLGIENGDRFYTRSDHYNFAKKGIPVVFFCDDEHADYHLPTDDADKIEYGKMERIVRLAFLLGYRTAQAPDRPAVLGRRPSWFSEAEAPDPAGEEEKDRD